MNLRNRKLWLWSGIGLLVTVAILVIAFEPYHIVPGLLRGEPFFRGRPASYWRERFRADVRVGDSSALPIDDFLQQRSAVPVLVECLNDSDRRVRWAAVILLWKCGAGPEAVPPLRRALRDSDLDVRFQAAVSLAQIGPDAASAVPDLMELCGDAEPPIRYSADYALWHIDARSARAAGKWQTFRSEEGQFSAMFPGAPVRGERVEETPRGSVQVQSYGVKHGPTQYIITVADYPAKAIEGESEDERLDAVREWTPFGWIGFLEKERRIEHAGYRGRDRETYVQGSGMLRTRLFWIGQRLYQVHVAYESLARNAKAFDFFLDSFRFEGPPWQEAEADK